MAQAEDKPGEDEPGEGGGEDDDMGSLANGAAREQELSKADELRVVQALIAMTVNTLHVPEDALRDPATPRPEVSSRAFVAPACGLWLERVDFDGSALHY